MRVVDASAADVQRDFCRFQEMAEKSDIRISEAGRPTIMMISAAEFERHLRNCLRAGDISDERRRDIEAMIHSLEKNSLKALEN